MFEKEKRKDVITLSPLVLCPFFDSTQYREATKSLRVFEKIRKENSPFDHRLSQKSPLPLVFWTTKWVRQENFLFFFDFFPIHLFFQIFFLSIFYSIQIKSIASLFYLKSPIITSIIFCFSLRGLYLFESSNNFQSWNL